MVDIYDEENDDQMIESDSECEASPDGLIRWLESQYHGDDRFTNVDIEEPGRLGEETIRINFVVDEKSHFFVSVNETESYVRVGFCTADRWVSEEIESESVESGDSLTEILEDLMEADEDLEYEVQHFHDDGFYFCSDIPYDSAEDLSEDECHDEIIYYLDGYLTGYLDKLDAEEEG